MRSKTTSTTDIFDPAFVAKLERLSLEASRYLRGGMSGEHASRRHLPAPTFSDHRPYTSGDDLRHIDWFAYARHNELHLKLGETEQDIPLVIALDRSASLDWGKGNSHKGRYALRLAGLLGGIALSSGDHVQVWPFHKRLEKPFGPTTGRTRTPDLLRYLSQTTFTSETDFNSLTRSLRGQNGGMLAIISDFWNAEALDDLLRQAAPPRWQTIVVHLLHPDEVRPPLDGALELEDSETGQLLEIDIDAELLRGYRDRLIAWVRGVERVARQRGATYISVQTDRPLEKVVLPLLRRRGVLRNRM